MDYEPPPVRVKNKPKTKTKQKFTPEEDRLIIEQVRAHGEKGWRHIAEKVPGRTARQCRERWVNYLSPNVSYAPWSTEDDELLNSLVAKFGKQWAKISSYFPSRTDVMLKNRWNSTKRYVTHIKIPLAVAQKTEKATEASFELPTENALPDVVDAYNGVFDVFQTFTDDITWMID